MSKLRYVQYSLYTVISVGVFVSIFYLIYYVFSLSPLPPTTRETILLSIFLTILSIIGGGAFSLILGIKSRMEFAKRILTSAKQHANTIKALYNQSEDIIERLKTVDSPNSSDEKQAQLLAISDNLEAIRTSISTLFLNLYEGTIKVAAEERGIPEEKLRIEDD